MDSRVVRISANSTWGVIKKFEHCSFNAVARTFCFLSLTSLSVSRERKKTPVHFKIKANSLDKLSVVCRRPLAGRVSPSMYSSALYYDGYDRIHTCYTHTHKTRQHKHTQYELCQVIKLGVLFFNRHYCSNSINIRTHTHIPTNNTHTHNALLKKHDRRCFCFLICSSLLTLSHCRGRQHPQCCFGPDVQITSVVVLLKFGFLKCNEKYI